MPRSLIASVALFGIALAAPAIAQVTGKVILKGQADEMQEVQLTPDCAASHEAIFDETVVTGANGALQNVVVSIQLAEGEEIDAEIPPEPAVLDQKNCRYVPRVLPVMVGQSIVVKNSDPFLHNVHGLPEENPPFNFGQPDVDPGRKLDPMKAAETFKVKCDIHTWMRAYLRVLDHPYFATTGSDGSFSIKGIPDGTYTLVAWHEYFGEVEHPDVAVVGGRASVDFEFDAASADADQRQYRTIRLAGTNITAIDLPASGSGSPATPAACCPPSRGQIAQPPTPAPAAPETPAAPAVPEAAKPKSS